MGHHRQEQSILQRQFDASPFGRQRPHRTPSHLAVFDFDSTLFLTPSPSALLWHPTMIGALTNEGTCGPGWWRDIRSLQLGSLSDLEQNRWHGFWNEDTVATARAAIADPNTMAIVLTGRRSQPFQALIESMLRAKSLHFDLVGLRPDPESDEAGSWSRTLDGRWVDYHPVPSVFSNTLHFKKAFLLNLLDRVRSIRSVTMWDDRIRHVQLFGDFLGRLCEQRVLRNYKVIHVPAIYPKFNPEWETRVIQNILTTHESNLINSRHTGKHGSLSFDKNGVWGSPETLQLDRIPAGKAVILGQEARETLERTYGPLYHETRSRLIHQLPPQAKWRLEAEQPQFNAFYVLLNAEHHFEMGEDVSISVSHHSQPTLDGMVLLVLVESLTTGRQYSQCLLPLWYRPSDHFHVKQKHCSWSLEKEDIVLQGRVGQMELLGMASFAQKQRHHSGYY